MWFAYSKATYLKLTFFEIFSQHRTPKLQSYTYVPNCKIKIFTTFEKLQECVTDKVYKEIGDHFRGLYGDYSGWAHSVLFSADLKHLQNTESEVDDKTKKPKKRKRKQSSEID